MVDVLLFVSPTRQWRGALQGWRCSDAAATIGRETSIPVVVTPLGSASAPDCCGRPRSSALVRLDQRGAEADCIRKEFPLPVVQAPRNRALLGSSFSRMEVQAQMTYPSTKEYTEFARQHERSLRYALVAHLGYEAGRDATQDALVFAWEHWDRIRSARNPGGKASCHAKEDDSKPSHDGSRHERIASGGAQARGGATTPFQTAAFCRVSG